MPSFKTRKIRRKYMRRRHDHEGLDSTHTPTKQDTDSFQSNILDMQGTIGNKATMQMMRGSEIPQSKSSTFNLNSFSISSAQKNQPIQRMPSVDEAIFQSSPNIKKTKFGTSYQLIIDSIRTLDGIYDNTSIGNSVDTAKAGFQAVLTQLAVIEGNISTYLAGQDKKGKGKKFLQKRSKTRDYYAGVLLGEIQQDRRTIAETMLFVATSDAGALNGMQDMSLREFTKNMGFGGIGSLSDADAQREEDGEIKKVGGGTNQLTVMDQGFFKENIDAIPDEDNLNSGKDMNLHNVSKDAGIHGGEGMLENARMANRDVAMSRLDQLLGAGVIAHSESMIYNMGGGTQAKGVLSAAADGTEAGKLGNDDKFAKTAEEAGNGKANINDPGLQRLLSRLQLIDNIAYQVDRQNSNYYLEFDDAGKVTGLTGIDNDMALGTNDNLNDAEVMKYSQYPGVSLLIDKPLAEKVMSLDTEILAIVMIDLLSPGEIAALISRVNQLKVHLGILQNKGQLLEPHQWNNETANALRAEQKGYYAQLANKVLSM